MTDQELIERYIREHGVTRCPTAAATETQATISSEDMAQHRARGPDPVGDAWRKKNSFGWSKMHAAKRAAKERSADE